MQPDQAIGQLAADHHGIIRRDQARRLGLTDHQIRSRVRTGRWHQLWPGVYRLAGATASSRSELAAAVAVTRGAASHRSAGWLLGLVESPPARPEVSVGTNDGHHRDGILLHRTADLLSHDTTTVDGIRTTTAIRTCIDMGSRLGIDELERFIERARHQRLVHLDPLVTRFLQLVRPGRTGMATTRAALRRLDPALQPAESDLETLLLQVLRRHGLPDPLRQHRVEVGDRRFRIDVAYPELWIAIESDGFTHHGLRNAFENDRERRNLLTLAGWTVLEFTWRQICGRPEWVAEQVGTAIRRASHSG